MSSSARIRGRWWSLVEALGAFALILLYIWRLRAIYAGLWLPILALILGSHWIHREGPVRLGFGWAELRRCGPAVFPWLLNLAMGLWGLGVVCGTVRPATLPGVVWGLCAYGLWGMFQQYLLNGYFVNRLAGFCGWQQEHLVCLAAGVLFASAHAPNWFLMSVTLPAGYFCARMFMRYRSVLALGLAHGVLGYLLSMVIPEEISAHLVVGPRYWSLP
jgi:hypothetical protein